MCPKFFLLSLLFETIFIIMAMPGVIKKWFSPSFQLALLTNCSIPDFSHNDIDQNVAEFFLRNAHFGNKFPNANVPWKPSIWAQHDLLVRRRFVNRACSQKRPPYLVSIILMKLLAH